MWREIVVFIHIQTGTDVIKQKGLAKNMQSQAGIRPTSGQIQATMGPWGPHGGPIWGHGFYGVGWVLEI